MANDLGQHQRGQSKQGGVGKKSAKPPNLGDAPTASSRAAKAGTSRAELCSQSTTTPEKPPISLPGRVMIELNSAYCVAV